MHLTMLELRSSMPFKKIENLFKLQLKFIRVGAKVLWAGALSRLSMYGLSCHPTSWIITRISAFLDLISFHMGWGDIKREVLMFTSAGCLCQPKLSLWQKHKHTHLLFLCFLILRCKHVFGPAESSSRTSKLPVPHAPANYWGKSQGVVLRGNSHDIPWLSEIEWWSFFLLLGVLCM